MSETYVRRLFDQYAARYDTALTGRLAYRGPALLREAVEKVTHAAGRPVHFSSMLDLGCGTGLGGAAFRPVTGRLVGVDLSPAMIAQAAAKDLYDRLGTADLADFLAEEAGAAALYQLVLAADVFVYVNDLGPIVAAVARVLAPGGLFAFTVETHSGDGVQAFADAALCPWRSLYPPRAGRRRAYARVHFRGSGAQRKRHAGRQPCGGRAGLDPAASAHYLWQMTVLERPAILPDIFARWFASRGWVPARASARTSGQSAGRPLGAFDRADRRRQDASRISAEPGGDERRNGFARGNRKTSQKENSSPSAVTCAARAGCIRSTSRRSRRSPSISRVTWKRRSPRCACRSASRRAPATRRPRSASASAAIRRRSC
jgi:SAM-dependent methyltransferase